MKAIKCPNCGSEQVKELTEEKYACMACDNVFLIHNSEKFIFDLLDGKMERYNYLLDAVK